MLRLVPPGRRKGNRFWLVRGRHGGRQIEKTTKTADREKAESFLVNYRRTLTLDRPAVDLTARLEAAPTDPALVRSRLAPRAVRRTSKSRTDVLLERLLARAAEADPRTQTQLALLTEIKELRRALQTQPTVAQTSAPDRKVRGDSYCWETLEWLLIDDLAEALGRGKERIYDLLIELGRAAEIATPSSATIKKRRSAALRRRVQPG